MFAYKKLKKLYGTDSAIAVAFGMTRQALLYWRTNGVPLCRAKTVEKITKGAVTAADVLRK